MKIKHIVSCFFVSLIGLSACSIAFHQGWHYAGELASDNVSLSGVSSDALMYIYNYQRITDNYHMSNMWGWAYRSIINSNKILEKAQEGESKEMDQLIGENYFLRGWLEFVLYRKGILRANPERPEESRNTAEFGVEHLRRSQCSQGSVVTRLSVHG